MRADKSNALGKVMLTDNGGRRFGDDRRLYCYFGCLPERRSVEDRRSGLDRREKPRLA